jgi:hypothetical protein
MFSIFGNRGVQANRVRLTPRRPRALARALSGVLFAFLAALAGSASARAQGPGAWEGPWDWSAIVYPDPVNPCVPDYPDPIGGKEFSHAALLAVGPWQGKVLLWRSERNTAPPYIHQTWIFDPSMPHVLFRVEQDLPDDIFCAGMCVDEHSNILSVGGASASVAAAFRFAPGRLGAYAVWNFQPPFQNCPRPSIPGNPWLLENSSDPNPSIIDDMSLGRYYPGASSLQREGFGSGSQAVAGGATFVLGGELPGPGGGHNEGANEYWQALPPHPATSWSQTFVAKLDTSVYPAHEYSGHPPPGSLEEYDRKSIPGEPLPHPRLNNYPRAVQLATIGTAPPFPRNILVANDVSEAPEHSLPGLSWLIRLRYLGGPATTELWRGRPHVELALPNNPIEGRYNNVIIRHDKTGNGQISDGRNRVIAMNGDHHPLSFKITPEVEEFNPRLDPAGTTIPKAAWVIKDTGLTFPRVTSCAVILPTGEIFVEGGERDDPAHDPPQYRIPALQPELYHPGDAGSSLGASSTLLALPNNAPGANHPYHRLYHHIAILLPDGRVFVAGGNPGTYNPPAWPIAGFSGEIYRPYYLDAAYAPYRPQILSPTPSAVSFGTGSQTFAVTVDHDPLRPVRDFVLIRPGAITHHFDSEQRYIELSWSSSTVNTITNEETHQVVLPEDDLGPSGIYMLFALRKYSDSPLVRIPSRAHFLEIQ